MIRKPVVVEMVAQGLAAMENVAAVHEANGDEVLSAGMSLVASMVRAVLDSQDDRTPAAQANNLEQLRTAVGDIYALIPPAVRN